MGWTKDTESDPPRVRYVNGPGTNVSPGLTTLIYDPGAPADRRFTAEFAFIVSEGETMADVEQSLGVV